MHHHAESPFASPNWNVSNAVHQSAPTWRFPAALTCWHSCVLLAQLCASPTAESIYSSEREDCLYNISFYPRSCVSCFRLLYCLVTTLA